MLHVLGVLRILQDCFHCIRSKCYSRRWAAAVIRQIQHQPLTKPQRKGSMGIAFHQQVQELMPQGRVEYPLLLQQLRWLLTDGVAASDVRDPATLSGGIALAGQSRIVLTHWMEM